METAALRDPQGPRAQRAAVIGYIGTGAVTALCTHIMSVMLPSLADDFGRTVTQVNWVMLGYTLALAISTTLSAWLANRFGYRRTYVVAMVAFGAASLGSALAPTVEWLVVARCAAGGSAGLLGPLAMSVLYRAYPVEDRPRILRVLFFPIALTPAIAPLLGGVLAELGAWRWSFVGIVPVAVALTLCAAILLPADRGQRQEFDGWGFALGAGGLFALLFGMGASGLTVSAAVAVGVGGAALLLGFVAVQLQRRRPLLDLRILRRRAPAVSTMVLASTTFAWMGGMLFLAPILLQERAGFTPSAAGLAVCMSALGVIASTQTLGRLYERTEPRPLLIGGLLCLAATLVVLGVVDDGWNLVMASVLTFVSGIGFGVCTLGVQVTTFTNVAASETGDMATIISATRQVMSSVGIAVASVLVATAAGFTGAFVAAAVVACGGALAASRLVLRPAPAEPATGSACSGAPTEPDPHGAPLALRIIQRSSEEKVPR